MQANPVGWFEIYVRDIQRARTFSENVFGVSLEKVNKVGRSEMWAFPVKEGAPGAAGASVVIEGGGPEGNAVIVYFSCRDCAEEAAKVSANGGKVVNE